MWRIGEPRPPPPQIYIGMARVTNQPVDQQEAQLLSTLYPGDINVQKAGADALGHNPQPGLTSVRLVSWHGETLSYNFQKRKFQMVSQVDDTDRTKCNLLTSNVAEIFWMVQ